MTLDELATSQDATILDVTLDGADLQRLLDMGFIEGTLVRVLRNAPLLDPIDISIRGQQIALRRSEAAGIEVEPAG